MLFIQILVRLYDVRTSQCYVSDQPDDQHKAPVTMVEYYILHITIYNTVVFLL